MDWLDRAEGKGQEAGRTQGQEAKGEKDGRKGDEQSGEAQFTKVKALSWCRTVI